MKYQFVRAAAVSPELKVADVFFNTQNIIREVEVQSNQGIEVLVFPELSLCGFTCGDLLLQKSLTDACLNALTEIAAATKGKRMLVFVGLPVVAQNKLYNCAAGIANGKVLGIVPQMNSGNCRERRFFANGFSEVTYLSLSDHTLVPMSGSIIFTDEKSGVGVACEIGDESGSAVPPSVIHSQAGASIIVNLSAQSESADRREVRKTVLSAQSVRNICAYLCADAGAGESTSDAVYSGSHLIYENGELLSEAAPFSGEAAVAEIDVGFLLNERKRLNFGQQILCNGADGRGSGFTVCTAFIGDGELTLRKVSKLPFVPDGEHSGKQSELMLSVQANALAQRLKYTNSRTAVLGVSGGLDSALALLVTARAFDLLGKPRNNIIAVTMPGFGTTSDTKNNSVKLIQETGAALREIGISKTVLSHFHDVGHDPEVHDAAYENAQARYRTMVLMDLANAEQGLVVGTGDLSELALGWCTYNGDHMSMYSVNGSVPKTLVKHLVSYEGLRLGGELGAVLQRIVNTDISPELLPPDGKGNIAQKTETLVGPYELHDFFLYRMLRCGDAPRKIYALACYAFCGSYDGNTIKKWLLYFYRRFFAQQFKRNCMPDGVKVSGVSLSPRGDWRMPSDASAAVWIEETEKL